MTWRCVEMGRLLQICLVIALANSVGGSLMSRIGLTLGGTPAHLNNQLDHHNRRLPWAVQQQMMEEDSLEEDSLPFLRKPEKTVDEVDDGRPPPCIGICYYQKLEALKEREKLLHHNSILKEDCGEGEDCVNYKAGGDNPGGHQPLDHHQEDEDDEEDEEEEVDSDDDDEIANNVLNL